MYFVYLGKIKGKAWQI